MPTWIAEDPFGLVSAIGIVAFAVAFLDPGNPRRLLYLCVAFAGALGVYLLDRLRDDPADLVNRPARTAMIRRFKPASLVLVFLCGGLLAGALFILPAMAVAGVFGAGILAAWYSIPIAGFRLKDIPFLKTLIAPSVVLAVTFAPDWIEFGHAPGGAAVLYGFSLLLFNMLFSDLRDIPGDRATAVKSIPVILGRGRTLALLLVLFGLCTAAGCIAGLPIHGILAGSWMLALWKWELRTGRAHPLAVEALLFLPFVATALG